MLNQIFKNTASYKNNCDADKQKNKGQYCTSIRTARFMAEKYCPVSRVVRILDPGAGNGSLGAAVAEHLIKDDLCDSISITFIEDDKEILPLLKKNSALIKAYCEENDVGCSIRIIKDNYILSEIDEEYDVIICNPPYKKIRKNSPESLKMSDYVYGQPNLYALFMAKSLELLVDNGSFIFITPRSWTSGSYFSVVRRHLYDELSFDRIHVFDERDNVFSCENVLQETMILVGIKREQGMYTTISVCKDDSFEDIREINLQSDLIKAIGKDKYLLIPSNKEEAQLINKMNSLTDTFYSLGYVFKTGPVVEFRNKDSISSSRKTNSVPLYRALNISGDAFVFPVDTKKAQYVSSSATNLLIRNENTVLIRRLSAKEDKKRIQSCVYHRQGDNPFISVENHVNYVVRRDGKPLSNSEAEWIQSLLSSDEYDTFFRLLNGSTQVNATELNSLPVRSVDT